MRLQREVNRRSTKTGKVYEKWRVVLPEQMVNGLGWEAGDELSAEVDGDSIVLSKPKRQQGKKPKRAPKPRA